MAELTLFTFEAHNVRVISDRDGNPWWVAADVCAVLGITNPRQAIQRLDEADVCQTDVRSGGQDRLMWVINESGLYDLIIRSDKPAAKPFRRWVTSEVLPQIRKTGAYRPQTELERARDHVKALEALEVTRAALEAAAPKVRMADDLLVSAETLSMHIEKWAKRFYNPETGKAHNRASIFPLLRERGILFKDRTTFHTAKTGWEHCFEERVEIKPIGPIPVLYVTPQGGEILAEHLGFIEEAARLGVALESPIETRLWAAHRKIGHPELIDMVTQHEVPPYRLDLALPHLMLGFELDGNAFHTSPDQVAHDQHRDAYLAELGWSVHRFTGTQVTRDAAGVLAEMARLAGESDLRA